MEVERPVMSERRRGATAVGISLTSTPCQKRFKMIKQWWLRVRHQLADWLQPRKKNHGTT